MSCGHVRKILEKPKRVELWHRIWNPFVVFEFCVNVAGRDPLAEFLGRSHHVIGTEQTACSFRLVFWPGDQGRMEQRSHCRGDTHLNVAAHNLLSLLDRFLQVLVERAKTFGIAGKAFCLGTEFDR